MKFEPTHVGCYDEKGIFRQALRGKPDVPKCAGKVSRAGQRDEIANVAAFRQSAAKLNSSFRRSFVVNLSVT
jgi:hypothetical protein